MAAYTRIRTSSDLFPVHVVDQDGFPHIELTTYASHSPQHHAPRTAKAYTGAIVAFASHAEGDPVVLRQGWRLLGPPEEARRLVSHVLTIGMGCVLATGRHPLSFATCSVKPTSRTHHGLERLLAALRSFYTVLHLHGLYPHAKPTWHLRPFPQSRCAACGGWTGAASRSWRPWSSASNARSRRSIATTPTCGRACSGTASGVAGGSRQSRRRKNARHQVRDGWAVL